MKIRISWVMVASICVYFMVLVTAAVVPALADNNTTDGTNAGQYGCGGYNTSLGYFTAADASCNGPNGSYNTATGAQAFEYQVGSNNTATGVNALRGPYCNSVNMSLRHYRLRQHSHRS